LPPPVQIFCAARAKSLPELEIGRVLLFISAVGNAGRSRRSDVPGFGLRDAAESHYLTWQVFTGA